MRHTYLKMPGISNEQQLSGRKESLAPQRIRKISLSDYTEEIIWDSLYSFKEKISQSVLF